jgi:small-conductance mechanosensitive channel/CRP-like cAMP-binding protein
MTFPSAATAFPPEVLGQAVVFLGVILLVALFLKAERRHAANLVVFFLLSLAGRAVTAFLPSVQMPGAARTIGVISLVLEGIAFINLTAILVFAFLALVRFRPPRIVRDLTVAAGYVALVFYIFAVNRIDIAGLVATSAIVTAIIGFSLQETLSAVMSGMALQIDRSIEPGDTIRFADQTGRVLEINWRHAMIETRNGDTLVIPNSLLSRSHVLIQGRKWVEPRMERRWIYFGVDPRATPEEVSAAILDGLSRQPIPNVAHDPLPQVLLTDFKESYSQYAVRYWLTDLTADDTTDSVIRTRIFYALQRAGIPPLVPATTVFLEQIGTEKREREEGKKLEARIGALRSVSLFNSLTDSEREELAVSLQSAPFAPGEAVVVQGNEEVHHLYILTRGSVEVRVEVPGAPQRPVATIAAPDFFGEMGMLTGEPRRATVVALTEVRCWRLEKERFEGVLAHRPVIADEISQVLAARDVSLAAARDGLSEEAKRLRLAAERSTLASRIRAFFNLA